MALLIYTKPDVNYSLTNDGTGLSPLRITIDGKVGGTIIYPLYIRNTEKTHYYEDIELSVYDGTGDYSSNGWEWRLIEKRIEPIEEEWSEVSAGNTLSLSVDIGSTSIGDISTFITFWLKVIVPRGLLAANIMDLKLRVNATKKVVGY